MRALSTTSPILLGRIQLQTKDLAHDLLPGIVGRRLENMLACADSHLEAIGYRRLLESRQKMALADTRWPLHCYQLAFAGQYAVQQTIQFSGLVFPTY